MSAAMGVTAGIMAGTANRPSTLSMARQVMPKALNGTMGSMIQNRDWVRASLCASKLEARDQRGGDAGENGGREEDGGRGSEDGLIKADGGSAAFAFADFYERRDEGGLEGAREGVADEGREEEGDQVGVEAVGHAEGSGGEDYFGGADEFDQSGVGSYGQHLTENAHGDASLGRGHAWFQANR
jgi:hypothetical protein